MPNQGTQLLGLYLDLMQRREQAAQFAQRQQRAQQEAGRQEWWMLNQAVQQRANPEQLRQLSSGFQNTGPQTLAGFESLASQPRGAGLSEIAEGAQGYGALLYAANELRVPGAAERLGPFLQATSQQLGPEAAQRVAVLGEAHFQQNVMRDRVAEQRLAQRDKYAQAREGRKAGKAGAPDKPPSKAEQRTAENATLESEAAWDDFMESGSSFTEWQRGDRALGIPRPSDKRVIALRRHPSFREMRKRGLTKAAQLDRFKGTQAGSGQAKAGGATMAATGSPGWTDLGGGVRIREKR
jgi:hypothetical protein